MVNKERKFLIGIAAPTNAGKTTLVNELKTQLGSELTVVNFDDYDLYPEGSERIQTELANPTITNWENPELFDYEKYLVDLDRLRIGLPITMNDYSRENQGNGLRKIEPSKFTVVEGVFVLATREARKYFDMTYYLDLPESEMVSRRLARTVNHDMPWDKVDYIKGPMLEGTRQNVLPQRQHANKVLDATQPTEVISENILEDIRTLRNYFRY